jgi:FAD/FMN-containing dehydrogenase
VQDVLADEDATVLGDLRPLRKKNDAPRLADLAVGSAGLLGVVTAATLELAHRPVDRATALLLPAGPLPELAGRLERGLGSALGALELVSGTALRLTVQRLDGVADPFPGQAPELVLLVETEGEDAESLLLDVLGDLEDVVADTVVLPPAKAWGLRHGVSEALALAGPVLGLDVSVPRAALEAVRTECADVVRRRVPGAVLADFGHVGDGGLHLNVVLPPDTDPLAVDRLRTDV